MTTCVHSSLALTMEVRHECFERCHVTFASDKLWNGAEKTALPFFFFLIQKTHHSSKENAVFSLHSVKKKYISLYPPNQLCVGLISSSKSKRGCIGLSSGAFHLYFPQSWLRWHRSTCRCRYNLACCSEQTAVKRHVLLDSVQIHRSLAWRQSVYCC